MISGGEVKSVQTRLCALPKDIQIQKLTNNRCAGKTKYILANHLATYDLGPSLKGYVDRHLTAKSWMH